VKSEPLDVQPRWFVHAAFVVVLLAMVVVMAMLRTNDLDFDEDGPLAVVLALCFWIFAIALGSLVRNLRAGYALRLDGAGLHIPGLEVVPWSAVRDARLVDESGGKRLRQIAPNALVARMRAFIVKPAKTPGGAARAKAPQRAAGGTARRRSP